MAENLISIHGRKLGIAHDGALLADGNYITSPVVDADITVGEEVTNVRAITIQLKQADGSPAKGVHMVRGHVMANAAGTAYAVGGSTGLAAGAKGALLLINAKRIFSLVSDANGELALNYTDTGTEALYLHLELPSGARVVSPLIQNT